MNGIQIVVYHFLCKPEFIRWRRQHRKSRINRKWQKRYGAVVACKGVCYEVNLPSIADLWSNRRLTTKKIVMCPCIKAALDRELKPSPASP